MRVPARNNNPPKLPRNMSNTLQGMPAKHRAAMAKLIEQANALQGGGVLSPREYKLFDMGNDVYAIYLYDFPLGIDDRQLKRVARMQYVTEAFVDFSQRGAHPESIGALCIKANLSGAGPKKRESTPPDGSDDDELELTRHRRRRQEEPAKREEEESGGGWIARLWR